MGRELKADPDYQMNTTLAKFYTAKSIDIAKDIQVMPGQKLLIPVKATFQDGHTEDVTSQMVYNSDDITFVDGYLAPQNGEEGDVEAIFTDFIGKETKETIHVSVTNNDAYFPTAVKGVVSAAGSSCDQSVYNLQGMKVDGSCLSCGLYIKGEKKMLRRN